MMAEATASICFKLGTDLLFGLIKQVVENARPIISTYLRLKYIFDFERA
jgi:hypothetical protein